VKYLTIKNWMKFQHYKDRNPPWIKLHRTLFDDYEFSRLQDASKLHLILIWLFASQNAGKIPEDANFLKSKLGLDKPPDLKALINSGFLLPEQGASNPIADGLQDASKLHLEKRREETEKNERAFTEFWSSYPRKVAKHDALKAWKSLSLHNGEVESLLGALEAAKSSDQWRKDNGQFIPHPAKWLRQRRFEDVLPVAPEKKVAL
jgi:hypothetical protein